MCGITGFVGKGERKDIDAMSRAIEHRGPDYRGTWIGDGVALGHARLSIIDTSVRGNQPMQSSDGRYQIVFNGEIYNYKELRAELSRESKARFKTDTDTEVLLELFAQCGGPCFSRLRGMFAAAIYDTHTGKLVLVRDRMGQKPLYWSRKGDTFIFGSELKALRNHPLLSGAGLSSLALEGYLRDDCVQTPLTIYEGIYKLPPASYLEFSEGRVSVFSYWQLPEESLDISFDEAKEKLDVLLRKSVSSRLISDVPLGVWLSGGLDSSTIALYASEIAEQQIQTFSIGFKEKTFDESGYAKVVADHLGTQHHVSVVDPESVLEVIDRLPDLFDEPVADASVLPTYLLSAFTRKHVKVALGGDGGDELFAGYPTFQAEYLARVYGLLPEGLQKMVGRAVNVLPQSDTYLSLPTKLQAFVSGYHPVALERHQNWLASFTPEYQDKLLGHSLPVLHQNEPAEFGDNDVLAWYMKRYLMDQVLVKVDRASMACGLEARAPLLDHELVSFVHSLPYSYKIKNGQVKVLLKALVKDRLPKSIVGRRKKGFGVPVAAWFKGPLKERMLDVLHRDTISKAGIFDPEVVETLKREHLEGKMNHGKKLWNLFVFELWRQSDTSA